MTSLLTSLIYEMLLLAGQRRDKEAALREQARLLVRQHWNAITALAEQLWSEPLGSRVDLGLENGWSDDSKERYMTGDEVRALLLQFQLNLRIV